MNLSKENNNKIFTAMDIFAILALVTTAGFISSLGLMGTYLDITPILVIRLVAAAYLIWKLHVYKKRRLNHKFKWLIIIAQIILAYMGTFEADVILSSVKFPSPANACLASRECNHKNTLYYSSDEPAYAIFRKFGGRIYYYPNNDGYKVNNFLLIDASYTYNEGNYLIEIYKLPDNYYIFVEVKDDDISKITDNSNKDFNYLHTLVNGNYNVRNYYGKTINKIEDYHLKVEDKELEINI